MRAKLTALYGGLFVVSGVVLLVIVFLLVRDALPMPTEFTERLSGNEVDPSTILPARPWDTVIVNSLAAYRSSTLATLLIQSAAALLITTALAVLLGWLIAYRVLRPLHDITATARRLGAEDLGRRIKLTGPEDELKELADTFDGMLDRLSRSFDSQRRFVANASHELRTPLALQRTLIDVAMLSEDVAPEVRLLGSRLVEANERTERILDGLLVLAPQRPGPVQPGAGAAGSPRGDRRRNANVEVHAVERTVAGDPVLLERLVVNLIDNAVTYNRPDGWVRVEVGDALVVRNTGPRVDPDTVESLFEPFRRGAPDRTGDAGHSGLGLSIVRSVALAHDGSATAEARPDGGLDVTIRLP
ncbi:histidine kinase [Kutzneria sp. 744]|nr:histidine kinase [Kutzneria sp. 744]